MCGANDSFIQPNSIIFLGGKSWLSSLISVLFISTCTPEYFKLLYLCFALSIRYLPCTSYFFSKKWADTVAITATNHQCLMCFFHFKEKTHLFFSWIHGSPSSCGLEPNLHIAKLLWMETQSSINVVWSLGRTYPQNEVSLVLLSHTQKRTLLVLSSWKI